MNGWQIRDSEKKKSGDSGERRNYWSVYIEKGRKRMIEIDLDSFGRLEDRTQIFTAINTGGNICIPPCAFAITELYISLQKRPRGFGVNL